MKNQLQNKYINKAKDFIIGKEKPEEEMTFTDEIVDFLRDLIIIVVIVLFIRTFIAMPFQINGQSMYSSYYDKEFIIVDRLTYHFTNPKRGDVIVFKPNVNEIKEFFLKRIIGTPGDIIRIEDGKVYVKKVGEEGFSLLDEPYLNEKNNGYTFVGTANKRAEYIVPKNQYFVIGDNRNHSTDSRQCFSGFGCRYPGSTNFIDKSDITGRLFLDLGYFNFSRENFGFIHPDLAIDTTPRFLNSPKTHIYE